MSVPFAPMSLEFDVAVIGAGPAGSSAGTLLAQSGRSVVIFDKEKFPRFRVGESMLPASLNTLERMGVKPKIDAGGFLIKHGGEIVSACGKRVRFYFRNGLNAKRATSYQVLRSEFDKILLDHAAETGCDVREQTPIESFELDDRGITLYSGDGKHVDREEGPDGTLTRMVRAKDSWFWMIPLSGNTTSIGVVMDTEQFRTLK